MKIVNIQINCISFMNQRRKTKNVSVYLYVVFDLIRIQTNQITNKQLYSCWVSQTSISNYHLVTEWYGGTRHWSGHRQKVREIQVQ